MPRPDRERAGFSLALTADVRFAAPDVRMNEATSGSASVVATWARVTCCRGWPTLSRPQKPGQPMSFPTPVRRASKSRRAKLDGKYRAGGDAKWWRAH